MKNKIGALLVCCLYMTVNAQIKIIPFGRNNQMQYDLYKGTYNVIFNGKLVIRNVFCYCVASDHPDYGSNYDSRTYWSRRSVDSSRFTDAIGSGMRYSITSLADNKPSMQQVFFFYDGCDYFNVQIRMATDCWFMSPLSAVRADLYEEVDNRALLVPFDNDAWVRYKAVPLALADFTGAEVTALYNNTSRHGLILGSIDHQDWKSGVRIKGGDSSVYSKGGDPVVWAKGLDPGRICELAVYGGRTDDTDTHDRIRHGRVTKGKDGFCNSPRVMVGWFDDWRAGLETYSRCNEDGRYVAKWKNATPIGWNSWGAMQDKLTLPKAKAVVDFFHDSCGRFRTADGTLYIDLDSYWDLLREGEDYSRLKEFCDYCKSKGFQPGIYWAPFVDWGKSARKMEGSDYNYQDCWTRQKGAFIDLDGARALDPTHPGTRARIALMVGKFKECGFTMIKIDFLGHAALEADHFYDTTVHTGMQAFRKGMEYLIDQLDGKMLVYAAISPNLATARYAQMRRIACDAYSRIDETAYTLNSTTYGWWLGGLYDHIDADHIVFKTESPGANRARLASALVTGTLITGDDYSLPGAWKAAAQVLLQNKDLLEVAREGRAFMPVEGNTGDKAGNFFVRKGQQHTYLAIVNYDNKPMEYTIRSDRWGIRANGIMKELFMGKTVEFPGVLTVVIPPADAVIYRMD
jgi:alpha-galactosidase